RRRALAHARAAGGARRGLTLRGRAPVRAHRPDPSGPVVSRPGGAALRLSGRDLGAAPADAAVATDAHDAAGHLLERLIAQPGRALARELERSRLVGRPLLVAHAAPLVLRFRSRHAQRWLLPPWPMWGLWEPPST